MARLSPAALLAQRSGRELWGAAWTLVRTDFKVRYHKTWLGFVWALIKPVTLLLTLLAVFSFVFADQPDYRLRLVIALFLWEFFAESTKVGLLSLHQKAYLLGKTSFPRWIVVVTSMANPLITLVAYSVAIVAILVVAGRAPGPFELALFGFYLLHLCAIALGFSLGASVLFLRWRDLHQVWEVITAAGFFATPVVFPIGVLPEQLHFWLYLWPPTPVIQFARAVLVDGAPPTLKAHLLFSAMTALIFALGAGLYRWRAPRIAELL